MLYKLLYSITPIQLYIIFSLIWVLINYVPKKKVNYLVLIISGGIFNEVISNFHKLEKENFSFNSNIYLLIYSLFWFLILLEGSKFRKQIIYILSFFIFFWTLDFLFFAQLSHFCTNSFILGALFYLIIFTYQSFYELKNNNLTFFQNNDYLLQSAPILLFLGLSFVLGFKNKALQNTIIFGTINLYQFISYFVNIVYYTIINVYIFKEKKSLKHV